MRLWVLLLALSMNATLAMADFKIPDTMTFEGKTYQANFVNQNKTLYEYTTQGETVNNWTTLVSIQYIKHPNVNLEAFKESIEKTLTMDPSKPESQLNINQNVMDQKTLYRPLYPDSKNPLLNTYEITVQRYFNVPACSGIVIYQWSRRLPQPAQLTEQEWLSHLRTLLNQDLAKVKRINWTPAC